MAGLVIKDLNPNLYPQGTYQSAFVVAPAPRWAGAMVGEKGSSPLGLTVPPSEQLTQLYMLGLRSVTPGEPPVRMTPGTVW